MALSVVKEDSRFRVEWQGNSTDWLPETASNRKVVLVFLRWLRDENGKPVFTLHVSDPSSIRKLVNPEIPVSSIQASERWTTFNMALYYYGVPLSVLGKWMGVHKTTILRCMLGLALPLWSLVYKWIVDNVKAKAVYVDEKWLKIKGGKCPIPHKTPKLLPLQHICDHKTLFFIFGKFLAYDAENRVTKDSRRI